MTPAETASATVVLGATISLLLWPPLPRPKPEVPPQPQQSQPVVKTDDARSKDDKSRIDKIERDASHVAAEQKALVEKVKALTVEVSR